MWIECLDCNEVSQRSKINKKCAHELKLNEVMSTCKHCDSDNIRWIIYPRYKKKGIGRFIIKDIIELDEPFKRDGKDDPRGPTETDFKFIITKRKGERGNYIWSPYWIKIQGQKKYGQYAPIIREVDFIELVTKLIQSHSLSTKSTKKLRDAMKW